LTIDNIVLEEDVFNLLPRDLGHTLEQVIQEVFHIKDGRIIDRNDAALEERGSVLVHRGFHSFSHTHSVGS
jgi:hypothetical protein